MRRPARQAQEHDAAAEEQVAGAVGCSVLAATVASADAVFAGAAF